MSMTDSMYMLFSLFGFCVTAIIMLWFLDYLGSVPQFAAQNETAYILAQDKVALSYADVFAPVLFIIFLIFSIAMAYMVNIPGVFIFLGLFMLLVMPFMSAYVANAYFQILGLSTFSGVAGTFVYTTILFNHLPLLNMAAGVLILIATFAKGRGGIQPSWW